MRRFAASRFGLGVLVVAALVALYGVAYVTRPAPRPPVEAQPRKVPVEAATATCPAARGEKVSVYLPGTLSREPMNEAGPYTVNGPGGLEAGYITRTTSGAGRGLAGLRCAEPAAESWLVGPGPARGRVTLHLVNADKAPAFADVEVYAAEGQVSGDEGLGMEIAPGEHRRIDLRTLAAAADVMAVSVTTFTGRLAVSARAELETGGVDWLPTAAAPATEVVVPAVPGGGGRRELLVAAPGETDATVRIKAVTEGAAYAMRGRESIDVPAGSVLPLDVTTGIGGESAALVLTSTAPVVAGVVITGTGRQPDVAFTAGTPALDLGSAVAANGAGSRLVLTAPDGAGKVRVQVVPEGGEPRAAVEVAVPAGRTRDVRLAGEGAYAVLVTPVSGRVYGGRVVEERLRTGVLITAQPLAPARLWTVLRPLTDTSRAVLP
ncbi:DUF5719 family protein [Nonomuraea sp. MCN248]|uniref:DUF5719 family protein n=1 Tax=Nonomuraea corallina TaxID=2989783 RepID=A0ABT4S774_9ACTN|nr:DUF5719 family protein [Nonomuraea corallina]MDA0632790.1 DUF5719 family protein [Nonomuraea corallina]